MDTRGKRPTPPLWQSGLLWTGVFGGLAAVVTIELGFISISGRQNVHDYDAAPVCASTANLSGCRFETQARIVSTSEGSGGLGVDVAIDQLGGTIKSTSVEKADRARWQAWEPGAQVTAEIWNRWVVILDGIKTQGNPDVFPTDGTMLAAEISGAIALVLLTILAWWLVLYRRVLHARADALAGKDPKVEVLPLTEQMITFLQAEARTEQRWRLYVSYILGAAVVIPAIPTVMYIVQGWSLVVPALIWLFTLSLAAILSISLLHHARQEVHDLDRGVFVRESGLFDTQLRNTKAGTCVIVSIGGWSYSPVWGESIQNVGPGTGSVAYLPVSQDVLEICDVSGRILWSLFAPAPASVAG